MNERTLVFSQGREYVLKKELGQGACGKTVLLYDGVIGEYFVCKKYSPLYEEWRESLFKGFVGEIKLLHGVHHVNVVRVFNYVLHPDKYIGYIFLEYVEGVDVEEYVRSNPEGVNEIFAQVVDGFAHLEARQILHRDIRPSNIMVTNDGVVKVIDFGFGKKAIESIDFGKSISLNWWCDLPAEFGEQRYDYSTEVYFVGKLFEKLISDNSISSCGFLPLLGRMVEKNSQNRISSFAEVRELYLENKSISMGFADWERQVYQNFSSGLGSIVTRIESDAKMVDVDEFTLRLENVYRSTMLEDYVASVSDVVRCFVNGGYYYKKNAHMRTETLSDFLGLLKRLGREKRNIIEANIHAKLKLVDRYVPAPPQYDSFDDDIPF